MLDVAFHRSAFLHLNRAGDELVGTHDLGRVERDAGVSLNHYDRHSGGNGLFCGDVGGSDTGNQECPCVGLVLNDRPVRKGNVKRIGKRRGRGEIVRENGGQHKGSIELAANGKNEYLLAHRGSPPCARAPGAGGQPLEPVGDNAAGLHATAPRIKIGLDNDTGTNEVADLTRDLLNSI